MDALCIYTAADCCNSCEATAGMKAASQWTSIAFLEHIQQSHRDYSVVTNQVFAPALEAFWGCMNACCACRDLYSQGQARQPVTTCGVVVTVALQCVWHQAGPWQSGLCVNRVTLMVWTMK